MKDVVIVSGARTAVGEFGGSLKDVKTVEIGALVIKEALKRAGLRPSTDDFIKSCRPDALGRFEITEINKKYYDYDSSLTPVYIDEVIMGNVLQGGLGQNPARQAGIFAGLPEETNAYTVNKVCASGMKAIALAAASIKAGDNEVVIAGGMENMSDVPIGLPKARWGHRMDMPFGKTVDLMVFDALYEIFYGYHMGITAENIAARYNISREEQDKLSVESHTRARNAIKNGLLKDEIVGVTIPQKKGNPIVFDTDERPMETSMEKLAKLNTAFKKDGTVTAGNASGINDAAAAMLIMNEEKAKQMGLKPLARIKGYASGGVDPAYMGLGPVPAVRKLLRITGTSIKDYGLFELNEAFAAQAIACLRVSLSCKVNSSLQSIRLSSMASSKACVIVVVASIIMIAV